jgi:hypothetical protein
LAFAEGWKDIKKYGKVKERGLKKFLPREHGNPNTMYKAISSCFMAWVRAIKRDIIAIDGKTVRRNLNTQNEYLERLLFHSFFASEVPVAVPLV